MNIFTKAFKSAIDAFKSKWQAEEDLIFLSAVEELGMFDGLDIFCLEPLKKELEELFMDMHDNNYKCQSFGNLKKLFSFHILASKFKRLEAPREKLRRFIQLYGKDSALQSDINADRQNFKDMVIALNIQLCSIKKSFMFKWRSLS